MFAHTPRKETATRILLIGIILFNLFMPGAVSAKALRDVPDENTDTHAGVGNRTNIHSGRLKSEISNQSLESAPVISEETHPPVTTPETVKRQEEIPELLLGITPNFITPGSDHLVEWEIKGISPDEHDLALQITLPPGFRPADEQTGKFDTASRVLLIDVTDLKGQFRLNTSSDVKDSVIEARLVENETIHAEVKLPMFIHEQYTLDSRGGTVTTKDGRIRVEFPQNTLSRNTSISIGKPSGDSAPLREIMPVYSLLSEPFEIKAYEKDSQRELSQFNGEISIEVNYADLEIPAKDEGNLYLYWYDPESQAWAALPTSVNPETKILRGITTHFSIFGVGVNNWQATHTPTIDSFQVAEFTGAATYSLPIEVPPGPGGLQPSLSLSYNSQVVDQAMVGTQASWVGMGWSLETGSIELNTYGTNNYTGDDTYMLNVGGVSTRLVRDPSGFLHAEDESFWEIAFDPTDDFWTVRDKVGNIYRFYDRARMAYTLPGCNAVYQGGVQYFTYKWMLSQVENIHGKVLTYSYEKETKNIGTMTYINSEGQCSYREYPVDIAIYPKLITYPNNRYQVEFAREARLDYTLLWDGDAAPRQYERTRLTQININHVNGPTITKIRSYDLLYGEDTPVYGGWIYPNYTVQGNGTGHISTLRAVREYGKENGGSQPMLPMTVFTYDDLHLKKAENGYGGRVEYYYSLIEDFNATTENSTITYGFDENCPNGGLANNYWYVASTNPPGNAFVTCDVPDPTVSVAGKIHNWNIYNASYLYLVRPGGRYRLTANATYLYPPGNATWRIGAANAYATFASPYSSATGQLSYTFTLNSTANWMSPFIETNYWSATVTDFKIELLPTYYRVSQKRVYPSATANNPDIYSYQYWAAGINNQVTSEAAVWSALHPGYKLYVEENSEFRGHRQVRVTEPDGKTVDTYFHQNDKLKGKPFQIEVRNSAGKLLSWAFYTYASSGPLPMTQLKAPDNTPYVGVERFFTYTSSVENRIYASMVPILQPKQIMSIT